MVTGESFRNSAVQLSKSLSKNRAEILFFGLPGSIARILVYQQPTVSIWRQRDQRTLQNNAEKVMYVIWGYTCRVQSRLQYATSIAVRRSEKHFKLPDRVREEVFVLKVYC